MAINNRRWVLDHFPIKSKGIEIGVWKGDWSQNILDICRPAELYLCDPWEYDSSKEKSMYGNSNMTPAKMKAIKGQVESRFRNYANVVICPYKSHVMFNHTRIDGKYKNYFDYIYIDGDHTFDGVVTDLIIANNIVKPGGIVAGDDYALGGWWGDGVIKGVEWALNNLNMEKVEIRGNQFVLRRTKGY